MAPNPKPIKSYHAAVRAAGFALRYAPISKGLCGDHVTAIIAYLETECKEECPDMKTRAEYAGKAYDLLGEYYRDLH